MLNENAGENQETNQEEEVIEDEDVQDDETQDNESNENILKENQTLKVQKSRWKTKAQELEKQLKEQKENESIETKTKKPASKSELKIETVLKLQGDGYSAKQISSLQEKAIELGVDITKLAEDEIYMAGFKASAEQERAEDVTPSPSGQTFVLGKKKANFAEVMKHGSMEERRAAFEQRKVKK